MKIIVGIFLVIAIFATTAFALPTIQKNTITWDSPTTNVDGSALTDLKGFRVYWSNKSGVYTDVQSKDVGLTNSINIKTVIGQLLGTYYFVVTAYNSTGNESGFSNEVSAPFFIGVAAPANLGIK